MTTDVGWTVRVPVLSLLFSDSLMAVTFRTTSEPAGITTRPDRSFTSLAIVAVTGSPTLFFLERISAFVAAVSVVPAAKLRAVGAAAGAGALAVGREGAAGLVAGRLGVVRAGAGAGALAVGRSSVARSFSSAEVSTGASCRSRLRLSAVAVSPLSPPPQAATAINVSPAIIALDISASLGVAYSGYSTR